MKMKFDPENYTIEYCPWCDTEVVIYSKGVTACPNCGKPLAPCSACEGKCQEPCPYGCDGTENDEHKPIDRYISQEEIEFGLKVL